MLILKFLVIPFKHSQTNLSLKTRSLLLLMFSKFGSTLSSKECSLLAQEQIDWDTHNNTSASQKEELGLMYLP
ncbi:hypothetical protein PRUPE_1G307000 [Prunus persica]|uniref:Uncharacterized protein n=1 Tax=Prunus persica TaxID=3760 RepID=A0A251R5L6_PRUPE|nr:hypothetical protein PRUPE_1G307000 [Prunus persica]